MEKRFKNRVEAGQILAKALRHYKDSSNLLILALPRGGVPVAYEVAKSLQAPLDVLIVRKLGVPGHEELAMGAIASGGALVMNDEIEPFLNIGSERMREIVEREKRIIADREKLYHPTRKAATIKSRTVMLIDDGLATGSTMLAAIKAVKAQDPDRIVVAVPLAPHDSSQHIGAEVDDYVCLREPAPFHAVGLWYDDFEQTSDDEVIDLLARSLNPAAPDSQTQTV